MKLVLLSVGSMHEAPLRELATMFANRIRRYVPFENVEISDVSASKNTSSESRKIAESRQIISKISPGDFLVLFDERGKELTSREFAAFIDKKMVTLSRNLVFVIGGAYGFSQELYERADYLASLSKMTFTHEMARVIALEQMYRAMTILRGEPYHHD